MKPITHIIAVLLMVSASAVLSAGEATPTPTVTGRPGKGQAWGYLGDGSGVMDATPPLRLDAEKPVWKFAVPSYGFSTPIVVHSTASGQVGGKVLFLCEPVGDCPWPQLYCLDDKDGKVLWTAELNHLSATSLTADQQTEAAKLWTALWKKRPVLGKLRGKYPKGKKYDQDQQEVIKKECLEAGLTVELNDFVFKIPEFDILGKRGSPYIKATLNQDVFTTGQGQHGKFCFGESFGTPVTDGEAVYVATPNNGFFCFDLAGTGKPRWIKHYPAQGSSCCDRGRSPIIYKDLLISDIYSLIRGIDRKTGELRWSAPVPGHPYLTPTVIRVGTSDIVLSSRDYAFLLPDGKPLKLDGDLVEFGCTAITKMEEPDVVFVQGGGEHGGSGGSRRAEPKATPVKYPYASRFTLRDDTLTAQVLWQGINGVNDGLQGGLVYWNGKIYPRVKRKHPIVDALTGKALDGIVPNTTHMLYVADGKVFGLENVWRPTDSKDPAQVSFNVCSLDGKLLAQSKIPGYTYACPFTLSGKRAYIRTDTYLWCFE